MDENIALDRMFADALTDAEVKAIARNRGFAIGKDAPREQIKNFFLTQQGVKESMAALSVEERAFLHLLRTQKENDRTVPLLECLYPPPPDSTLILSGLSFNERYARVMKEFRAHLLRSGLVLFYGINMYGSRLANFQFDFPKAFEPLLPPLITPREINAEDARDQRVNDDRLRKKIMQLVDPMHGLSSSKEDSIGLSLHSSGSLYWGGKPLANGDLLEWQLNQAEKALAARPAHDFSNSLRPIYALFYVTNRLRPEQWFLAEQLEPILRVMCFGFQYQSAARVLEEAWEWGVLSRLQRDGKTYYSPRFAVIQNDLPIWLPLPLEKVFEINASGAWADLNTLPPVLLYNFNLWGKMKTEKTRLLIEPDLEKLTAVYNIWSHDALLKWLNDHAPTFTAALRQVGQSWGKVNLHEGCLVAHITHAGLRTQLQNEFRLGVDYVPLAEDWFAIASAARVNLERMVAKSKLAVKWVRPE